MTFQVSAAQCPTDRPDFFCRSIEMYPHSMISELEFYLIPAKILSLFQKQSEKSIILKADWQSPYFGAGISVQNDNFELMILGGTTRIDGLTANAYAALICHELGHVFGGLPRQTLPGAEWSSAEGAADFFAAQVCLPEYFKSLGIAMVDFQTNIEESGFQLFKALEKFDSSGFNTDLFRFQYRAEKTEQTLINTYPSLQCRYENFLPQTQRPACWFL